MRIAILGNSGSGKSTLAKWLAEQGQAARLDLDTVAWEPGKIAVPRAPTAAADEVRRFCQGHQAWVVEGCYANLVQATLPCRPRLIFLNPGAAQCVAQCRARPWEPHKYATKAEQDERLAFLLDWVQQYYTRAGDLSLAGHAALFAAYTGPKHELHDPPDLNSPTPELLAWLQ